MFQSKAMFQQQNRTNLRVIFWCVIAVAMSCVAMANADEHVSVVADSPWTNASSENPSGGYRYTANGWENTVHWRIGGEEAKVKFIDNIHPAVWMLVVVLAASGLAILASDEDSVQRLWSK